MRLGRLARFAYLAAFGLFLLAPLIVVIGVSLNETRRMSFPPEHFSFHWYAVFLGDADWMAALGNSLLIAVLAAGVAMSVALPLGYALWKYGSPLSKIVSALGILPFMLPGVVVSIVFLIFWGSIGHAGRIEDTIISHAMVFLAVPLLTVNLGFRLIDRALIEAAETMGAREADAFRTVVLPILLPYIVSGFAFTFVLSLNEYIIAYMVTGYSVVTLPIKVFNSLRAGFEPTMCVGATLFLVVGVGTFGLIALLGDLPRLLGAGDPPQ